MSLSCRRGKLIHLGSSGRDCRERTEIGVGDDKHYRACDLCGIWFWIYNIFGLIVFISCSFLVPFGLGRGPVT